MAGSYFKPTLGPVTHHTSKTHDPRLAGVTAGGDGAEAPTARERVWIIPVAMVVVLVAGIAAVWWILSRGGSGATDSLAADGILINEEYADVVSVEDLVEGGYTLRVTEDATLGTVTAAYGVGLADSMPSSEGWEPYSWPGADAATNDAEFGLALSDGTSTWIFNNGTAILAEAAGEDSDAVLVTGWEQLERIIVLAGE